MVHFVLLNFPPNVCRCRTAVMTSPEIIWLCLTLFPTKIRACVTPLARRNRMNYVASFRLVRIQYTVTVVHGVITRPHTN